LVTSEPSSPVSNPWLHLDCQPQRSTNR